jgi:hypothetical protein
MDKIVYILIIVMLILLIGRRREALMVPGVANREETEASFLEDREWFDKAEKNFYSRYKV